MTSPPPCERLDWDSDHFGINVARIMQDSLNESVMANALSWCHEHSIDCTYLLVGAADYETAMVAQRHDFRLTDLRITLRADFDRAHTSAGLEKGVAVRPYRQEDESILVQLAGSIHDNTRFAVDPGFSKQQRIGLYERWMRSMCSGDADAIFVAIDEGAAVGYITCHKNASGEGSIELVGVHKASQGKGLGQHLVWAATEWFKRHGIVRVHVVTQGRNIAAQMIYQHGGFVTTKIELWFHRWRT